MRRDRRDDIGVHIEDPALRSLLRKEVEDFSPQFCRPFGRSRKETLIALIQRIVEQDEVPHIDVLLPGAGFEAVPAPIVDNEIHNLTFVSVNISKTQDILCLSLHSTRYSYLWNAIILNF